MTTSALSVTMLAVFVIAAIFLFAAVLFLNKRPPAAADPRVRRTRRTLAAASVVCAVVGLALMLPPVTHLLTAVLLPA